MPTEAIRTALEALTDIVDLVEGLVRHQGAKLYAAGEERIDDAKAAIATLQAERPAPEPDVEALIAKVQEPTKPLTIDQLGCPSCGKPLYAAPPDKDPT